ncbi:hypothetical protein [Streptomyces sp. NPDC006355]|uniref:hypothetical protein n=1 Tax=Streptomyces sp. NPDC006355 TaxID=3156758 RepID=UPI0033A00FBD
MSTRTDREKTPPELTILPPLSDFTTTTETPPGTEVLDLGEAWVRRLTDPGLLTRIAARLDTVDADRDRALHALFAAAAAAVLRRPGPEVHDQARLRAVGMALRLAGREDPGLTLSLDDLELRDGSTESVAAVVRAAARTTLFEPETRLALDHAGERRPVRIVVDTDQQLPAAVSLVAALGAHRITLCGRFAAAHRDALGAADALRGVRITDVRLMRSLRPEWSGSGRRRGRTVRWVTEAAEAVPDRAWAGWLDAQEAAAVPPAAWRTCQGLVLTVARLDAWEAATSVCGTRVDLGAILDRLGAYVPVGVDLLVGAPGVDPKELSMAVARLTGGSPAPRPAGPRPVLAGLRAFRLPLDAGSRWDGTPMRIVARPGLDLPRHAEFTAPGTLTAQERTRTIHALLAERARDTDLFPGRLAAAVTCATETRHADRATGQDDRPSWDPSAQVVATERADVDGRGPGTFVAHLRTGAAFRLHPRLVQAVSELAAGRSQVIERLPRETRSRLFDRLTRAGALRRDDI